MRTREAYRNVNGKNFSELRSLFKGQHSLLEAIVHDISRKVQPLGHSTSSTIWNSLAATRLASHNERFTKQNQIVEALLDDHEFLIRALTVDKSTAVDEKVYTGIVDFVTGLLRKHTEMSTALRVWLQ